MPPDRGSPRPPPLSLSCNLSRCWELEELGGFEEAPLLFQGGIETMELSLWDNTEGGGEREIKAAASAPSGKPTLIY